MEAASFLAFWSQKDTADSVFKRPKKNLNIHFILRFKIKRLAIIG